MKSFFKNLLAFGYCTVLKQQKFFFTGFRYLYIEVTIKKKPGTFSFYTYLTKKVDEIINRNDTLQYLHCILLIAGAI